MSAPLSQLQTSVFELVRERCAAGVPPTGKEIDEALGLERGLGYATCQALIRKGMLGRDRRSVRGLFVPGGPDLRAISTAELVLELERRGVKLGALDASDVTTARRPRTCAATVCGEYVRVGHLMCRRHWFALPQELRAEILHTHGQRDAEAYQDAVRRAVDLIDAGGGR